MAFLPDAKIFGLGLSKTGTSSLGDALNILGIKTIHYPNDETTFHELQSANYRLSVLEEYQGIVDIPVAPYYAQLDSLYPGSKFILTVRDMESWLRSIDVHWRLMPAQWEKDPRDARFTKFMIACVYGSIGFNRDRFRYVYELHERNLRTYFEGRPDDFLVIDICGGEGWDKLCPFLGVPTPTVSFPYANRWMHDLLQMPAEIAALVPPGETFILVDQTELGDIADGRHAIPFLDMDGIYGGPPVDDATAIRELERLRQAGAKAILFAWPAFWWLDYYAEFHAHLRTTFRCLRENERLIAFDLTSGSD